MRVALIDPSLFTLPYDARLAAGLRAIGHAVSLHGRRQRAEDGGVLEPPVVPSFYSVAGLPALQQLPKPLRLGIKGIDHLVSMARLRGKLARERPDVIHFQWLPLPAVDSRFLAGLRSLAPLVLTVHDSNPFNGNPAAGVQQHGLPASFRQFDRLIVHTAQGRARLQEQGVDGDRIAILPHGLLISPNHREGSGDVDGREIEFLLFGKLKPYKGADLLIQAFARVLPAVRARARLRIIGKPYMDLAPLRDLADRLGVADRVAIEPRFVTDSEIPGLFGPRSVAVFPYREIEASGVLSLAIAHARPILASRLGGFAETVRDGLDGLLVPPGDVAALADAMARFVGDDDFVAACARNVAALADAIPDWREIACRTSAVYRAAAASQARDDGLVTPLATPTGRANRSAAPPRPSAGVRP
ncbi:MAG TPA: glycosyltransferase [Acetobacteraceae bacterium]|nr:glycosyltransferase [Acetobacteraceae bacterium]